MWKDLLHDESHKNLFSRASAGTLRDRCVGRPFSAIENLQKRKRRGAGTNNLQSIGTIAGSTINLTAIVKPAAATSNLRRGKRRSAAEARNLEVAKASPSVWRRSAAHIILDARVTLRTRLTNTGSIGICNVLRTRRQITGQFSKHGNPDRTANRNPAEQSYSGVLFQRLRILGNRECRGVRRFS